MRCNPEEVEVLHSGILSAGIADGFYFGRWDQYPKWAEGLDEIGAAKSAAVIVDLIDWLKPHYEIGGIEAVWKGIEADERRRGELSDRYFETNGDVKQLILDLGERELSE